MRDIIWTIIIVWLVYKFVEIFRAADQKKKFAFQKKETQSHSQTHFNSGSPKSATRKSADNEGEYVDYEEIP